jgi:hypothetical protein
MTKSTRSEWEGHAAQMGKKRNASRVLVGKPDGKRPLGTLRGRWEDNIKRDLKEMGFGYMDWISWLRIF